MQRSLLLFEESIKSKFTRKNYTHQLAKFLKFTNIRDYDSLLEMDDEKLQMMVEDYVIHLKKNMSPNSVSVAMTGVKHFFVMNRKRIYWETIQKMYPQKVKSSGRKPWTNEHIQKMLEYTTVKRNKALIHFLASTGARIGVCNYPLQMQHLRDMGDGCKAVMIYAGEPEEYWAFLTPEATKSLDDYLQTRLNDNERFYPNTPIFRIKYHIAIEKPVQMDSRAATQVVLRVVNKGAIQREKVTNVRYDIQLDHGFRKRFNTILKINNDVNSNIAEKLMAHKNGLDGVYFTPTIDQCFAEFKKAISELTVSSEMRQKIELEKERQDKSDLEKTVTQNKSMQKTIEEMSLRLSKLEAKKERHIHITNNGN